MKFGMEKTYSCQDSCLFEVLTARFDYSFDARKMAAAISDELIDQTKEQQSPNSGKAIYYFGSIIKTHTWNK